MLRIDPAQQQRLRGIRASLTARIAEAEREGWTGEAEGLKVSLAAAGAKLAEADAAAAAGTPQQTWACPPTATSPDASPPGRRSHDRVPAPSRPAPPAPARTRRASVCSSRTPRPRRKAAEIL